MKLHLQSAARGDDTVMVGGVMVPLAKLGFGRFSKSRRRSVEQGVAHALRRKVFGLGVEEGVPPAPAAYEPEPEPEPL